MPRPPPTFQSPMRCRHFGECGGCSLPGMDYGQQLARKHARLSRLLRLPVEAVRPSPLQRAFRHKVAFAFGPGIRGRSLVMGHYAGGSRRIVPVQECPIHGDRGNRLAFALRDALVRGRVDSRLPRHVLVRTTSDGREAVALLVARREDRSILGALTAFLAGPERPDGLFLNVSDHPNPFLLGRKTVHLGGVAQVRETSLGSTFLISPAAFFQPNVSGARHLLDLVLEGVGAAEPVLDLYCGGGFFGIPLARRGTRVVAVEENPQGIEDLRANLAVNEIPPERVRAVCGKVEAVLGAGLPETFGAVVLDPPRTGCAPGVIDRLFGRWAPPRAVYVSCNPQVLATDLPRILAAGYRAERVAPVDMFPHTDHVETVVVLARG